MSVFTVFLPVRELEWHFFVLSGYIHTNLRDFRLSTLDTYPFVSYDSKEFDKVYRLAILTSDIVIYLLILGIWMDIGYYSEETGAKFLEVIVRELRTEKLSHFLKELPSLRRLVYGSSRKRRTLHFRNDISPKSKPRSPK